MEKVAIIRTTGIEESTVGGTWALVTRKKGEPIVFGDQIHRGLFFYKDEIDEYVCCDGEYKAARWFFVKYCYKHKLKLVEYEDLFLN